LYLKGYKPHRMSAKKTTAQFIEDAVKVHGDKYDYSLAEYVRNHAKVKIICKEHGVFEQRAGDHIKGRGCLACSGNLKKTTDDFIREAQAVHNYKFDYSLVDYTTALKKVKIICRTHGVFEQKAISHLRGGGCSACSGCLQHTTESFVKKAIEVHNGVYDYSLVNYTVGKNKIKIICKIHGVFEQKAQSHLIGSGCKKCYRERQGESSRQTKQQFITKARVKHNSIYDYSLVEYTNSQTKVKIICPSHGIFELAPAQHLYGIGCKKCGHERTGQRRRGSSENFIDSAKEKHGDIFDYSLVNYTTSLDKVKIICKTHGVFKQKPYSHLRGDGCPTCGGVIRHTDKSFIEKAKEQHGDKYDYSLVEYKGNKSQVSIICRKHGVFRQKPNGHMMGAGCPSCNESKGERRVHKFLDTMGLNYIREKRFENCRNKKPLPFDFYLPDYNLLIEYDGHQHFRVVNKWGGKKNLQTIKRRDAIKNRFAERHNIRLLRIPYTEYDRIEEILSDALKLEYQPLQLSLFAA
jgi:very-short-patch-repair endonuclease